MRLVVCLLCFIPAAVLQAQLSDRIAPPEFRPDFILAVALVYAMVSSDWTVTLAGFAAGVLESSLAGTALAAFIVSRVIASFAASSFVEPLNLNVPVGMAVAAASTAIAYFTYLLVQPTPEVLWWMGVALRQSLVTAVLAGLLVHLAARVFGARSLAQPSAMS